MRFLTPAEVAALADSIDSRYRAAVLVGAYGGLRAGELFGLRAQSVDPLRRRVDVAEIVVEVRGTVPLPRFVAEALADHLVEGSPGFRSWPDAVGPVSGL